ncbi:MAG: hypothetical protein A2289_06960 [Deltaproteobacteria bacterium RIFOXYA12_FULL_58_15]|nr:MAG: hypothetical protein A2289_06960 [Deltaproteobacteria bacterium RIFOXYA12_FULL_58_15]
MVRYQLRQQLLHFLATQRPCPWLVLGGEANGTHRGRIAKPDLAPSSEFERRSKGHQLFGDGTLRGLFSATLGYVPINVRRIEARKSKRYPLRNSMGVVGTASVVGAMGVIGVAGVVGVVGVVSLKHADKVSRFDAIEVDSLWALASRPRLFPTIIEQELQGIAQCRFVRGRVIWIGGVPFKLLRSLCRRPLVAALC